MRNLFIAALSETEIIVKKKLKRMSHYRMLAFPMILEMKGSMEKCVVATFKIPYSIPTDYPITCVLLLRKSYIQAAATARTAKRVRSVTSK